MHELTLAEDLIQLVENTARREQARGVKTVVVEIGRLSTVEPDALRFAFDEVKRGGLAAEAALRLIDVPGAGLCRACGKTSPMDEIYGTCTHCGSPCLDPVAGQEMRVKEIEIAT